MGPMKNPSIFGCVWRAGHGAWALTQGVISLIAEKPSPQDVVYRVDSRGSGLKPRRARVWLGHRGIFMVVGSWPVVPCL